MINLQEYYETHVDKLGTRPKYRDKYISTTIEIEYKAFWLACMYDELKTIKTILSCSTIDIDKTDFAGNNAFILACAYNPNLDVIIFLQSVTKQIKNKNKRDALFSSFKNKNLEIMHHLLRSGFSVHESIRYDSSILGSACGANKPKVVDSLIRQYHVDINSDSYNHQNGFYCAVYNKKKDVVDYLLSSNYFILFGPLPNFGDIKISEEQREIMDLIYSDKILNVTEKDKIVLFFHR
ncbi:MAG: hypothetical protein Dasosvirus1_38 [Dasosvirus sp.]|uniref:Uncharacterized protein n=1 Tax=Dasosvirus sp. TaxID=2487764 RepID=A0A3G4ZUX3_9VIRU|nr:MAG: hypothetical protein Dasosvirus1_38 [Dasosvirus sp.]